MMDFQFQFTEAINFMRKEKYVNDVIFNYPLDDRFRTDDNTAMIFHDEALLPHWREVALACKLFFFIIIIIL